MVIRSSNIPEFVYLWNQRVKVAAAFIPGIRRCVNCGQLNHSTKFCQNNAKCLNCGEDRHPNNESYSKKPSCINCKREHKTLSLECSEINMKKQINRIMAIDNISYNKARDMKRVYEERRVFHSHMGQNKIPSIDNNNFPRLRGLGAREPRSVESVPTKFRGSSLSSDKSFAEVAANSSKARLNEDDKELLLQIENAIINSSDTSLLLKRIIKACNLHKSVNLITSSQHGLHPPVELPKY